MFEFLFGEIKRALRMQIEMVLAEFKLRMKRYVGFGIFFFAIVFPVWIIGIGFLMLALFYDLASAARLASTSFITGLLCLLFSCVMFFIALLFARK